VPNSCTRLGEQRGHHGLKCRLHCHLGAASGRGADGLAQMVSRSNAAPRLIALFPQWHKCTDEDDSCGLLMFTLAYTDDIRAPPPPPQPLLPEISACAQRTNTHDVIPTLCRRTGLSSVNKRSPKPRGQRDRGCNAGVDSTSTSTRLTARRVTTYVERRSGRVIIYDSLFVNKPNSSR
jgi:hypothetical protein